MKLDWWNELTTYQESPTMTMLMRGLKDSFCWEELIDLLTGAKALNLSKAGEMTSVLISFASPSLIPDSAPKA